MNCRCGVEVRGCVGMRIIRSKRRTLAVEILRSGEAVVRAPYSVSAEKINEFLYEHSEWIEKHTKKRLEYLKNNPEPTAEEIEILRKKAKAELPEIVEKYAKLTGLFPSKVTVTSAKTRFGSCSTKGSVCFSLYLMNKPKETIEYVVLHELVHLKHHNHSAAFYKEIEKYMPDYKFRESLLKG